jgi:hypothetical protein
MAFLVGQGLFGKIQFVDGTFPQKDRMYLIVSVSSDEIGTLNISSLAGKEQKLLYPYNKEIINYRPPFQKRSFIKLDSLMNISISEAQQLRILSSGQTLDNNELRDIITSIKPSAN